MRIVELGRDVDDVVVDRLLRESQSLGNSDARLPVRQFLSYFFLCAGELRFGHETIAVLGISMPVVFGFAIQQPSILGPLVE